MIAELLRRIAALEAELARLKQNSSNSSRPPSADPPGSPRRSAAPTGRPRGGQPGHKQHKRELLPTEQVTRVVELRPQRCGECRHLLAGSDPAPLRSQSIELPRVEPLVTEYRQHQLGCARCGTLTRSALPAGVSVIGPRLSAAIAVCSGKYRLSKRVTQELLSDFLGIDLALGSICKVERRVSEALATPVEEARAFIRRQDMVHLDETGWREDKQRAWLWTAASEFVTVFTVSSSRGAAVAKEIVGEDFSGFIVSDRWPGYDWAECRQLCWAHLLRDFQGFVDRGGDGAVCGGALLDQSALMFRWWHRVRDGTLTRDTFRRRMRKLERRVERLLRRASFCGNKTTSAKAFEIYKLRRFLWTFVDTEFVPPTNNAAERAIRPAVLWPKGSFGTDSANGSRFVERILSVVASLKQQGRHVLDYLAAACTPPPRRTISISLLPAGA
jgi:transposase